MPPRSATRLEQYGPNELTESAGTSKLQLIWQQISSVMVLILIGAALLSLALGKYLEAGAIGAIVVLFAALGFFQEYRAEQAIAALRRMAVPSARVTRGGLVTSVPVAELVPGDIVHLDAGTVVPADMRLIEVASLRIEEAALTGESEPVDKQVDAVDRDDLALGDRVCMAYSGTQVSAGRGKGVVVATGMRTELGHIASLLQDVESEQTPLQRRLDSVGKQLALLGILVALAVVVMGAIAGESAADLVLTAISVAVAVIPEGLPAVVTFTLAIGAQRMLRRQALIRKLPGRRDARIGDRHLFRQDGHAHRESDDGHGARRRRPSALASSPTPAGRCRGRTTGASVGARRRVALQRRRIPAGSRRNDRAARRSDRDGAPAGRSRSPASTWKRCAARSRVSTSDRSTRPASG